MTSSFRSGFISFVGRPNAGKSTLINALVGTKVAITSRTAQTTRAPLRAIVNGPDFQLIAIDTPGLHKPHDRLGESLNTSALRSLEDVDGIVMVVDASAPVGRGDQWVAASIAKAACPRFAVLNKIDKVDEAERERAHGAVVALGDWSGVYEVSAKTKCGVEALKAALVAAMPEGPAWFPQTMVSDAPLESTMAEIVREKLLRHFREEVPHALAVSLKETDFDEKKNLWTITMTIYTDRPSQKAMVIGKQGATIKKIGTLARHDLEKLLGANVFLSLTVDVRRHWRDDEATIARLGYGERS